VASTIPSSEVSCPAASAGGEMGVGMKWEVGGEQGMVEAGRGVS